MYTIFLPALPTYTCPEFLEPGFRPKPARDPLSIVH